LKADLLPTVDVMFLLKMEYIPTLDKKKFFEELKMKEIKEINKRII